jgi:flagellar basal-body rod modification protein FlgD
VSTISSSTPLGPADDPTKNTTKPRTDGLGRDAFLQLLVTQMSHQNPLQPQEDGAFIAQLAQFSSLEQLTNIDTTLKSMADAMGLDLPEKSSAAKKA